MITGDPKELSEEKKNDDTWYSFSQNWLSWRPFATKYQLDPKDWPISGSVTNSDTLYFELGDIQGLILEHTGTWQSLWGRGGCRLRSDDWAGLCDGEWGCSGAHNPVLVSNETSPMDDFMLLSKNITFPGRNAGDLDLWKGVAFGCASASDLGSDMMQVTNLQIVAAFWRLHDDRDLDFAFASDFIGHDPSDGDKVKPDIIIGIGTEYASQWQYANASYPEDESIWVSLLYMYDGSLCAPLVADSSVALSNDKYVTLDNRSRISEALLASKNAKLNNLVSSQTELQIALPPVTQNFSPPISPVKYITVVDHGGFSKTTPHPGFISIDAFNYDWGYYISPSSPRAPVTGVPPVLKSAKETRPSVGTSNET